jgi:hypothetical protein
MSKKEVMPEQETINPEVVDLVETQVPEVSPVEEIEKSKPIEEFEEAELVPEPTIEFQRVIKNQRFFESEILYETNNSNRSAWDLTDALIDLESIFSVERILEFDRFSDFGCEDPKNHELHPEECCVIFSSAYPLGVILVETSYEVMCETLIEYRG